jgi:hypothetical protein
VRSTFCKVETLAETDREHPSAFGPLAPKEALAESYSSNSMLVL